MVTLDDFQNVYVIDFEFRQPDGHLPVPLCFVAKEWRTGRVIRRWLDGPDRVEPFLVSENDLVVAYYASAEIGCFLELGWPLPRNVLDLYAEFRWLRAGRRSDSGYGLHGALQHFNLRGGVSTETKEAMRQLAQQQSLTAADQLALLDYCEADVADLEQLLDAMYGAIDLPRALVRGRYMVAAARIERVGVPIDVKRLQAIRDRWPEIRRDLIGVIDRDFGVFENGVFKASRWLEWCARNRVPWPLLPSGKPCLTDDTFRDRAKLYPAVHPIKELRVTLGQLKLGELTAGPDGRNRYLLSAFGSKTGRKQPSTSKCIFGPATWIRFLIKPLILPRF